MKIVVELPDDIAQTDDPGRAALEALVIAGYRSGELTPLQTRQLLGLTRMELDGFLKAHGVQEHAYDVADLEADMETLRHLDSANRR